MNDETGGSTVQEQQKQKRDRSKLPRWAQQEIDRLERDLASANERLSAGPEDSDTFADSYSEAKRPLGKRPSIEFVLGERWDEKLYARLEGKRLCVRGGSGISVHPQAGNSILIEITR